ncbi:MAG: branched-chain amino acid transaminase [Candidatus Aminicenantes bacterium]|nr:branched-chain amino acid transaminase [Candidatus Aminicenantes bacterium]
MFETTHFPKAKKFWYMGKFSEWEEPTIHVMSHALHYGTSVFEGIRAYNTDKGPAIFRLPEHMDRLMYSASVLNMDLRYSKEEIRDVILSVMKENKLDTAYIRPLLFYSYGNLGLVPKHSPPELMVAAWEWSAYLGEAGNRGAHVNIIPWRRIHHSQFDQKAKLGGLYVLSTLSGVLARNKGYDEAVYLNIEGNIAEGPGANICIIKDGVLKTNDTSESILEGITRTSVLKLGADIGLECQIGPITKQDFFQADEAFFTGTAVEIASIVHVTDDSNPEDAGKEYSIGTGKVGDITKKIKTLYLEVVRGQHETYADWLTHIY